MHDGPWRGQHVGDSAAAYALGALEPGEREQVERHRRVCPACDRLLITEERLVGLLPFLVRATPPPSPDVKVALLARVAHAHRARSALPPARFIPPSRPTFVLAAPAPLPGAVAQSGGRPRWSAALLAAPVLVALAVLGTLAVQYRAQAEERGERAERFGTALDRTLAEVGAVYRLYPAPAAPEARGSVVAGTGRREGTFYVKADPARVGERYRLFGSADGASVPLAVIELDGRGRGAALFTADRSLSSYREFVVKRVSPGRGEPALRGVGAAPAVVGPDRQPPPTAPAPASGRPTRIGDVGDATAALVAHARSDGVGP